MLHQRWVQVTSSQSQFEPNHKSSSSSLFKLFRPTWSQVIVLDQVYTSQVKVIFESMEYQLTDLALKEIISVHHVLN